MSPIADSRDSTRGCDAGPRRAEEHCGNNGTARFRIALFRGRLNARFGDVSPAQRNTNETNSSCERSNDRRCGKDGLKFLLFRPGRLAANRALAAMKVADPLVDLELKGATQTASPGRYVLSMEARSQFYSEKFASLFNFLGAGRAGQVRDSGSTRLLQEHARVRRAPAGVAEAWVTIGGGRPESSRPISFDGCTMGCGG
jgi:hypothetical protein